MKPMKKISFKDSTIFKTTISNGLSSKKATV